MAAARLVDELTRCALGRHAIAVIGDEPRLAYNCVLLSSVTALREQGSLAPQPDNRAPTGSVCGSPRQCWHNSSAQAATSRRGLGLSGAGIVDRRLSALS